VRDSEFQTAGERVAVITESEALAAIAEWAADTQELIPRQVFLR
jgi:hypothetical protein